MENPHGNNEQDELIVKLLKSYDNVRHEEIETGDESTYIDDMTLYELKINEPHIVFAIMSKTSEDEGIMKFHAMNLNSLIYYLSDVGRIYTNWVINHKSSEFGKLLLGQNTFDAQPLSDTTIDNDGRDVLGNQYLNMDGLNEGRGGKQGKRRFFKLEFNFGSRIIDSESVNKLHHLNRSKIFILKPKYNPYSTFYGKPYVVRTQDEIEKEREMRNISSVSDNEIYEEIRYGNLQSNFGISESHGQKHRGGEVLYQLLDYEEVKDDLQTVLVAYGTNLSTRNSTNSTKDFNDLSEVYDLLQDKIKYENKFLDTNVSFIEKITRTDTEEDERRQMNFILSSFLYGVEYDKNNYFFQYDYEEDYSYLFSSNNINKIINLLSESLIFPIYIKNIPQNKAIYFQINNDDIELNDIKKYLILKIDGQYKIGLVTHIYSNLSGRDDEDDEIFVGEEDGSDSDPELLGLHPNKGHWIYKLSFTDRIPILIGEKANELVMDRDVVNDIIVASLTNEIQKDGEPFILKSFNECQEILRDLQLDIDIPIYGQNIYRSGGKTELDTTDFAFDAEDVITMINSSGKKSGKIKQSTSNVELSTSLREPERPSTPPPYEENLQPRPPFPPSLPSPLRQQNTSTQNVPFYANALWQLQQSNQPRVPIQIPSFPPMDVSRSIEPITTTSIQPRRRVSELLDEYRNRNVSPRFRERDSPSTNSLTGLLDNWSYDPDESDDGGSIPTSPRELEQHRKISEEQTPPGTP